MSTEPLKILVVDDEPDLQELVSDFIEMEGFECETASGGEEAYEKLKSGNFTAVVSDIRMPKRDGVWLLEKVQEDKDLGIPVILASGYSDYEPEDLKKLGAFAFMTKPIDFDKLIGLVKEACAGAESKAS